MPYFSSNAKQFFHNMKKPAISLQDVDKFLKKDDSAKLCRNCCTLVGRKNNLQAQIQSILSRTENKKGKLTGGQVIPYGNSSISLPKGQHIAIILTLQQDPLTVKI